VEKDSQGTPKKFHIKEEVPDDLPAGDVPIAGIIKLGHDLKCTLADHFAVSTLNEPFDAFVCVHSFDLPLYLSADSSQYIPNTAQKKKFLSLRIFKRSWRPGQGVPS
jgi:hypothetical protein